MIYVCILLFIILIISYISSNQSIFAPAVIVSGIWFVCTFLYLTLDHGLYPITNKFLIAISIWVSCFCFFSLLAQSLSVPTPYKNVSPSKVARDIFFYFSLITLPFLIYDVYILLHSGLGSNIFSILRNANVSGFGKQGIERTSSFFVIVWFVSYIIELQVASKSNRLRIAILLLMNIFYAFVSMGKSAFLSIFVGSMFILFYQKKIKPKTIFVSLIILYFFFIGIQTLRTNDNHIKTKGFISLYVLAGIPAFETLEPASSIHFGESTFRFFYAANKKLGISDIDPENPILKFVQVPIWGNVYTVLYPFYKDFGMSGIAIFGSILGLIFGYIFNQLTKKDIFALTLYSLLAICLITQFMNEVFFTTFSMNLQFFLISLLPFYITKHKLFEKH